ncbi:RNA methyltransferase [Spirochaetia bacterium]|nr:RNA methyltransferase [Spirochaetia bacterium]
MGIPLHKLEKLPRHQRLRKIAKIFAETENRLCAAMPAITPTLLSSRTTVNHSSNMINSAILSAEDCIFFAEIAGFLQQDSLFSIAAITTFKETALLFSQQAAKSVTEPVLIRRALNVIRHILLAETGRSPADWDFIDGEGRLDPARRRPFPGMHVYLEDIRSPFNVGAMFRSAESFGAEKIFLSPLCADPRHPRAERSAMGCVDALPWERRDLFAAPNAAGSEPLFALETGGTPLGEFIFPRRGIIIAGSEELGVSPLALAAADASLGRVSIPCYGAKGSLNVSVAFGIVMQAWAQAIVLQPYA